MNIAFRADASIQIGTGHVMRCLTLATELHQQGHTCRFLCRDQPGHLAELITCKGFPVELLPSDNTFESSVLNWNAHAPWLGVHWLQDAGQSQNVLKNKPADWLVVDHYALDKHWEQQMLSVAKRIMVIDDLGDRNHSCDLLLDQNYGSNTEKYQNHVPDTCKILTGPSYALLRPEFAQLRKASLKRRTQQKNIKTLLVTMGGVDPDNYTGQILQTLKNTHIKTLKEIIVVMGGTAPHLNAIQLQALAMPIKTTVKKNISNMAEVMANADLAIGAAGATTWERCSLGLPTIQLVIAENQRQIAYALAKDHIVLTMDTIQQLPEKVCEAETKISELSQLSANICNGTGVLSVCRNLLERKK